MLVSSIEAVRGYDVIDLDTNFSDHLPLFASFECSHRPPKSIKFQQKHVTSPQLRWDRTDLLALYEFARDHFEPILQSVNNVTQQLDNSIAFDFGNAIDRVHDNVIHAFNAGACFYVPHRRKEFYRFWWDQEMNLLEAASIESNLL
jgi:hypothetical protein